MRIRRNSSPADLSVMRDKALDLGYTWDVTTYPTPAWDINFAKLRYDRPLFGIPVDIWNRELRLWSCDCAERVVHKYEDWARVNLPGGVNVCRELIQAGRDYANGLIQEETLFRIRRANYVNINLAYRAAFRAYYAAYAAAGQDAVSARSVVVTARSAEEVWYSGALAQRLDKVAPWHL